MPSNVINLNVELEAREDHRATDSKAGDDYKVAWLLRHTVTLDKGAQFS